MHKEVTTIAGKGRSPLFRRAVLSALLLGCSPLFADDTVDKGRATVRETEATVAEPKRAFETVLLAQGRSPRVDTLPDSPPTIIINEAPSGVLSTPVGPDGTAAPLYLDTPPSEQPYAPSTEWKREILPDTLLWQPPLANPLQPRFYLKSTNLTKFYTEETIDTGIGATLPMVRWTAPNPRDLAWQFDFIAFHMSRWTKRDKPVGQDYRYGAVVSGATGNWSWKIAYEHTSCHTGDELIKDLGPEINRDSHIREEVVLGLAYTFWEQLRVYVVGAYAFSSAWPSNEYLEKNRLNWGIEWVSPVAYLRVIQPYGAVDVEYRGDQRYFSNLTMQAGIRIQAPNHRSAVRFGFEYYRGNSPFGQFFDNREDWMGIIAAFDY